MAISATRSNVKLAGISSVKIKVLGDTPTCGYYSLGEIRDGTVELSPIDVTDSLGRPQPHHFNFVVRCKSLRTHKTNMLEILDVIGQKQVHILVTMIDTSTFASELLNATTGYVGCKWRFVNDGNADADRFIEWEFSRRITNAEWDTLRGSTAGLTLTQNATDSIYAMASLVRADIEPAGITAFTFGTTGTENTLGSIRNPSMTVELLTESDSLGRQLGYAMKIDVSVETMEAANDNRDEVADLAEAQNDFIVTLVDGTVFTFDDAELGTRLTFMSDKDSTGSSFVRVYGGGVIPQGTLAGIIS